MTEIRFERTAHMSVPPRWLGAPPLDANPVIGPATSIETVFDAKEVGIALALHGCNELRFTVRKVDV